MRKLKSILGVSIAILTFAISSVYIRGAVQEGWELIDGKYYWYENSIRQGYDANDASYRGKEIYDPQTDAWYWLDNVQQGAKAVSKDVYQESLADDVGTIGKWVRYDEKGHMIKGWDINENGTYYFDLVYGTMLKGNQTIDGVEYYFNEITGVLESCSIGMENHWVTINGIEYWYEGGIRQGYNPNDASYRGKEIYDPQSDAWYWLDNIQQGAKAISKDVYQESFAGDYADREDGIGKWVRYDANGHMVKGWNEQNGNQYYFDLITGAMVKKTIKMDGYVYTFHSVTGILENSQPITVSCNLPQDHVYYKYEYAYKSGDISGLTEKDMAFYKAFKECLDYAYQFHTPYEQEKAVHDYIILNCDYGYMSEESFSPYGVFVDRIAVCGGYMTAFKICMDVLGIECVQVIVPEMDHAWNAVNLDGEWYMVDVTWDDPLEKGNVEYTHFNIPDFVMKLDHDYTSEVFADGRKYSGDVVLELTTDSDLEKVDALLKEYAFENDKFRTFALYVKKTDGSNWTENDYDDYYWKLRDLPYASLYQFDSAVYRIENKWQGNVDTILFRIQGKEFERESLSITSEMSIKELIEKMQQKYNSMEADEVFVLETELANGTSFGTEADFSNNAQHKMYSEICSIYFDVTSCYMGEKNAMFICRKKWNSHDGYTEYFIGESKDIHDVNITALLTYLQECPIGSEIILWFENISKATENIIEKQMFPAYELLNMGDGSFEDGNTKINYYKIYKTEEIAKEACTKAALCNLYPFSPYYKYEYAYKYNDISKLSSDEMKFYNSLKGYLDYANQFETAYDQEKAIHDYMILRCKRAEWSESRIGNTAEDVFVEQISRKTGYIEAFQICMDILGIDCESDSNCNVVRLEDKWYITNVYWDDYSEDMGVCYSCFNIMETETLNFYYSGNLKVDAPYVHADIKVSSMRDIEKVELLMKEKFFNANSDLSFFRVMVTKTDGTKWSDTEISEYVENLDSLEYAKKYNIGYLTVNDGMCLWIDFDGIKVESIAKYGLKIKS